MGSGDEGGCGYVKVSDRCRACHNHGVEGVRGQESARQPDSSSHQGGEEIRQVHHPWLGHDQDSHEACDESGEEGGLRQSGHGQSQASYESCQSLLRGGIEKEHLSDCNASEGWLEHICGHSTRVPCIVDAWAGHPTCISRAIIKK